MDTNATSIAQINGRIAIINANISAEQEEITALNAAIAVLTNGYTTDQTTIATAISSALTPIQTQISTAISALQPVPNTVDPAIKTIQ